MRRAPLPLAQAVVFRTARCVKSGSRPLPGSRRLSKVKHAIASGRSPPRATWTSDRFWGNTTSSWTSAMSSNPEWPEWWAR